MLDVLAELIIDLVQGKKNKKNQQTGQQRPAAPGQRPAQQQPGQQHWPAPSADDPYRKIHPSDAGTPGGPAAAPEEGSIADIMRRMFETAQRGGADAPVLVPGYDKPPGERAPRPATPSRRVGPRVAERQERQQARKQPQPAAPAQQPQKPAALPAERVREMRQEQAKAEAAAAAPKTEKSPLDFVAELRNNPDAARKAFVYAEVFGRPLGERE